MTVGEGGRPARTSWERMETYGAMAALLRCQIFTGRTHQIRVHLSRAGFPIEVIHVKAERIEPLTCTGLQAPVSHDFR